ncbi:protein bag-of-marbles [Anastrepha obliqua]|uniref:protein bag-of-marbles n=1 Tax=Anastrepha obliqua TaxID=95512 RepID=UPI002409D78E|nr:protein bag-of-marbles [Anastrepha obliqua]XP_054745348.1 protein bag-of-marbles [Anastrepha obliqua]
MSSNLQPSCEKASQLLNFNMESISHELSSLLIGGELDGLSAIGSVPTTSRGVHSSLSIKEAEILQLYRQYYYQLQLQHQQQYQQSMVQKQHFNTMSTSYAAGPTPSAITTSNLKPAMTHGMHFNINNCGCATQQTKQIPYDPLSSPFSGANGVPPKLSASPKFEFHFLRCQSSNKLLPDTNSVPLISSCARSGCETEQFYGFGRRNNSGGSSASGNGQRRFMKHGEVAKEEVINYENVVIDLSVLGLSSDYKEHNPVLRLFGLFRKMHYYLNDVLPALGRVENELLNVDNPQTNKEAKCSMPCTMNVQYQVRQAARKCTIFLCDMQRILNANKIHSLELYLECEQSLNILRKLLTQFEAFKRVEMEHKRGQFITEDARVQTQRLEGLVEQLSDQIRETHIYVHAFNWAVERSRRSMAYNLVKEEQASISNNNKWLTPTVSMSQTSSENIATETKGVTTKSGIAGQSLLYDGIYGYGMGVVTVVDNDSDIDRQSTRYIGYK